MGSEPKLIIAGDNDLASDSARYAISSGQADPVYLWRSMSDPIVAATPVVVLADPAERAEFARTAIDAGLSAVSLPIAEPDERIEQAVLDGKLTFISSLNGLPTIARLVADNQAGVFGRRYGVYAAHRLPRNFVDQLDETLADLTVLVASMIDSPLKQLSATMTPFGRFVLARFDDETIATIEVSAVLPPADEPNGELLVEVTGSDAVLRAEPERQSILINSSGRVSRQAWYAEPSEFLLSTALASVNGSPSDASTSALRLSQHLREASASEHSITVSSVDDQSK
jgi:hypothetical protein